jgi:DUF971 family protein
MKKRRLKQKRKMSKIKGNQRKKFKVLMMKILIPTNKVHSHQNHKKKVIQIKENKRIKEIKKFFNFT